jgi:transcriptional regulator with XRE-family HTH domain
LKSQRSQIGNLPTLQQVQKYEKGANRISAGRLELMSRVLQVPIGFFFEGLAHNDPSVPSPTAAAIPSYVADFLATRDGLALVRAFTRIPDAKVRRAIIALVEQIAPEPEAIAA